MLEMKGKEMPVLISSHEIDLDLKNLARYHKSIVFCINPLISSSVSLNLKKRVEAINKEMIV